VKIADLFCKAGGSAMGLHRAGFEVVGFDIEPQPRYPFEFHLQDALTVDLSNFDAVWASPPCQFYSRLRHLPWLKNKVYWRSIPPTRDWVQANGKPYIIENVEDAAWDMVNPTTLCGQSLGLSLYRHRCFETWPMMMLSPGHQKHTKIIEPGRATLSKRRHGQQGFKEINRDSIADHISDAQEKKAQIAMGIDWMTKAELTQAIPPAYAEFLGKQLMEYLRIANPYTPPPRE